MTTSTPLQWRARATGLMAGIYVQYSEHLYKVDLMHSVRVSCSLVRNGVSVRKHKQDICVSVYTPGLFLNTFWHTNLDILMLHPCSSFSMMVMRASRTAHEMSLCQWDCDPLEAMSTSLSLNVTQRGCGCIKCLSKMAQLGPGDGLIVWRISSG